MDNLYLSAVIKEIASEVQGRSVARVSLSNLRLQIDLRLGKEKRLLVSIDRSSPAVYITSTPDTKRSAGDQPANNFIALLRKHIFDATLETISKAPLDRIVRIDFERLAAGDNRVRTTLLLILTGRSGNAHLLDSQGNLIASLFEKSGRERAVLSMPSANAFDPASLTEHLSQSATQSEVLDGFWGPDSIFGPQLKREFVARCADQSPVAAFKSLVDDLFIQKPIPLVYSKLPLGRIGLELIGSKADLLLSPIELTQARGMRRYQFESLSEAADEYYSARARATAFQADYSTLRHLLASEIARRESTLKALESDRARFQNPDGLKRCGDLILANLANAKINGSSVTVVDYYATNPSEIQIEIPEGARLQDAAAGYFARYQKARRALESIAGRQRDIVRKLDPAKELLLRLEQEPTDELVAEVRSATDDLLGRSKVTEGKRGAQRANTFGRRFKSSDGYEIVVGRNDRENDALTFRVARPNDIWLHAADYPGSHVIVRNPSRDTIPHRTIIEAAELAAFYSQAKREGKAAVHYTHRKLVSKPPRSKPGLVRLSSFKTALVEPRSRVDRIE